MWFKKKDSDHDYTQSVWHYLISKKLWISISLSLALYALNLILVWLMNKDAVAITALLFICFILSVNCRLWCYEDREGWHFIISPLSDVATVIFALACVSTIADADFKPVMMQPFLKTMAGMICGFYGFILCREIYSIGYETSKRRRS